MLRASLIAFLSCGILLAGSANVKDMTLEYHPSASGVYSAMIHNHHAAAATAYVAEAYFGAGEREQRTAFGGDALGHIDGGGIEVHPGDQEMGYSLPRGAAPSSTGFSAAIYADGYVEGNEDVISMLLSGRARSYADLKELIPMLDQLAKGEIAQEPVMKTLEAMMQRDRDEAKDLGSMIARSGLRYQFFMGAVPAQAMERLQAGAGATLAVECRAWLKRLEESKPGLK